jgi:HK97 family phage major capsid protein
LKGDIMEEKIYKLRQARGVAYDQLQKLINDKHAFETKKTEIELLDEQIARAEAAQKFSRSSARHDGKGPGLSPDDGWRSVGEQMRAIQRASYPGGGIDQRLIKAPLGMGETDPSGGGFMLAPEFSQTILMRAYDMGEISQRMFRLPIESPGLRIRGIDEQSRATGSRWGGVHSYWVGEGDSVVPSAPKFRLIELYLKKLMCVWQMTDELLEDTTAITGISNQAFSEEIMFMLEDAAIHGSGTGQPQGILNATATVTVAPEKGQAPKTFLWENALNMWANTWARSRSNLVWFINQEIEPQIYQLRQVVGTGGSPIYVEPGGARGAGTPLMMLGRPVIPVEYCEAPGTPGDVILADFSQYLMAERSAMQQMSSIHVAFLTDQMTFRLTYRCDGQSIWHVPLTPFRGTGKRSPFVILGGR